MGYFHTDIDISIHVPLAGNVEIIRRSDTLQSNFYPRSPCGERRPILWLSATISIFLSTFPLRGTSLPNPLFPRSPPYFYPRSPCGERPQTRPRPCTARQISIHVPLAGNVTRLQYCRQVVSNISIHVPLAGNVHPRRRRQRRQPYFYPRSPCGERHEGPTGPTGPTGDFYPRSPCGERPSMQVCRTQTI